jgi:hypothetical protein
MRQESEEPLACLGRWNELSIPTQSYLTQKGLVFKSGTAFDALQFKIEWRLAVWNARESV